MTLSLARWENARGSSAGSWLVRELPGVVISRNPAGWAIRPRWVGNAKTRLGQIWGEDYDVQLGQQLVQESNLLDRFFATRREALAALQLAIEISEDSDPALASLLATPRGPH